jgi:hypothetical protein
MGSCDHDDEQQAEQQQQASETRRRRRRVISELLLKKSLLVTGLELGLSGVQRASEHVGWCSTSQHSGGPGGLGDSTKCP